ncbi:MAG: hypothetical protein A2Y95_03420 [Deltaproteobacteria bacterium RBG_13_65_10]|nr:MAG: hypothetical protein A2Y95_03420 [Deltaproteobacteria bacterium RBG_13_65_10]
MSQPSEECPRRRRLLRGLGPRLFLIVAAVILTPACSAPYLIHLGIGQGRIMLARQDYRDALRDPALTSREKSLILLVQEAKRFGEEQIGLTRTDNFDTYVKLDRPAVSWTVTAAPQTRLESYQWWFPIVGRVPYKGFFSKDRALREARGLEAKGYETYVGGVAAYSTLGYFADPLFSTFLRYPEAEIPEIILHELTHATVFFKGSVDFNEGLATFVGNKAGVAFLEQRFGRDAPVARAARARVADDEIFGAFLEVLSKRLEALYARGLPEAQTLARRQAIFDEEKHAFERLRHGFSTHDYDAFARAQWNNALILAHRRYYGELAAFERIYASQGQDLGKFVAFFREVQKRGEDPMKALRGAARTPTDGKR